MKIALIGQKGILVTHDGGIETHVENLALELLKLGHEVTVYCRKSYMPEELVRTKTHKGIELVFVPNLQTKYLDTITYTFTATLNALGRKFDVIHYQGIGPSILSFLPRLFSRAKVIVTFHSLDRFHAKWGPIARLVLLFSEWTACMFPQATIVVSKTLQQYCWQYYAVQTILIPNGVRLYQVDNWQKLKQWNLVKDKYLLSVARFVRHKGIHYLIKAFKNIKAQHPEFADLKLALVGGSPYPNRYSLYLERLAANHPDIVFTGYQTGEKLDQLFSGSYLYIHPSEAEGLSMTILEAMSYGRCVLVSDIPENEEAVAGQGFYFKNKNVKDLEEKIRWLLEDEDSAIKIGEKAREWVKEHHDWGVIARETAKVYSR